MPTTRYLMNELKKPARHGAWISSAFLVLTALCGTAWPQPDAGAFLDVAEQLARYFPKVTGEVVKVDDDHIYIGVGARHGVLQGLLLTLSRPQQIVSGTDTEQAVNRLEEAIGYVVVEEVFEHYALARLLALSETEARLGDKVRITSGPIVLGVLPIVYKALLASPPESVTAALQSALEVNERFQVVTANRILLWSLEHDTPLENGLSPSLLLRMADSLRFSYAVVGTLEEVDGEPVLDVVLLSPQLQRFVASGVAFLMSP